MRFCKPHWEKLKVGVQERGLWHLCAKTSEAAIAHTAAELGGDRSVFDPLLGAHWMIINQVISIGGLYLLGHNPEDPEGHFCPLCEVAKHTSPPADDEWTRGCLDEVRAEADRRGLLAKA